VNGLDFKQDEFKTSIVILTFNKLEYTMECIQSIRDYTQNVAYEIIVIDNGSTDGTREWLLTQQDIITILNEQNLGFPKGCNQGIEISSGNNVLLLNNDVIVTEHWLDRLLAHLYRSNDIGAVGPVTNSAYYYQSVPANYSSIQEMHSFANDYHLKNRGNYEERLKLIGFSMLIKKEVIDKISGLDERFSPGHYEDDDFSYRMLQAGYKLILCKDVFIHHYGHVTFKDQPEPSSSIISINREKFTAKWGFDSLHSSYIREDLIKMIDMDDTEANIKVLEIGCACGGTLLGIRNRYKNAELYGIELNVNSAAIAATFANVSTSNVENGMDYEESFFDYIILSDTLGHLNDPWTVITNLKKYLNNRGKVISSIPNIMHHSVLREMLHGRFQYGNAGLLDRKNLRFFTGYEIKKMFEDAGYYNIEFNANVSATSTEDESFIEGLSALGDSSLKSQLKIHQYLIKAAKTDILNELSRYLRSVLNSSESIDKICNMLEDEQISYKDIVQSIDRQSAEETLNALSIGLYERKVYDGVFILLKHAMDINPQNNDTLYNMGYFLYKANELELALSYFQMIQNKDSEIIMLIQEIRNHAGQ